MGRGRYAITLIKVSGMDRLQYQAQLRLLWTRHSCGLLSGIFSLAFLDLSSSCYLVVKLCTVIILLCGGETVISTLGDQVWWTDYRTAAWKETYDT